LASPSYPADPGDPAEQDYVYYWKRDGAIAAMEIAADGVPMDSVRTAAHLADYVTFANICDGAAPLSQAKFSIEGNPYPGWPPQTDGPALETLALLQAYPKLDPATQVRARAIVDQNTTFLLQNYQRDTFTLWEEEVGDSFFAQAVQLRCLRAVRAQPFGVASPPALVEAITWLTSALAGHWNGDHYLTFSPPLDRPHGLYDPNSDVVMACVYGEVDSTDPKLLATAAKVRTMWEDDPTYHYPVNDSDRALGIGPLIGRYPGDTYDGDGIDTSVGHPWALCTCNFAELYYRLARAIAAGTPIPTDPLAEPFLSQVGISATATPANAAEALRRAGDRMLYAVVYHSDNLELSEQFDRSSGYEKSVSNLTWSYAAFLSAVRARP
jgi:glucoamylase